MMLLLPCDVMAHFPALRGCHGECAVSFLPCKITLADFLMHPTRRHGFHIAHHIGKARRCAQPDEQMHMVGDTADGFRHAIKISHHTAEICVQPFAPRGGDEWRTIFRAEYDVIMQ